MKYNLALLFVLFITIVKAQNTPSDYLVSDITQNNLIEISIAELNNIAKEYGQTSNFTDLKVQKVSDHYVLLAKDLAQKWIYAFELKKIDSKLFIDLLKHVNACESEILSINIFTIKQNEIDGCLKLDHHVLGRN